MTDSDQNRQPPPSDDGDADDNNEEVQIRLPSRNNRRGSWKKSMPTWLQPWLEHAFPKSINRSNAGQVALLCSIVFGWGICYSLQAPYFPPQAHNKYKVSDGMIGDIISVYEVTMLFVTLIAGRLTAIMGVRFMIGCGMFMDGALGIAFGALNDAFDSIGYVPIVIAIRALQAFGSSLYVTAAYAAAAALFPRDVAFVYSLMEFANCIAHMLGPIFASAIFSLGGSFGIPFYILGVGLLIAAAITAICIPSAVENMKRQRSAVQSPEGQQAVSSVAVEKSELLAPPTSAEVASQLIRSTTSLTVPPRPGSVVEVVQVMSAAEKRSIFQLYLRSPEVWIICIANALAGWLFNFPEATLSLQYDRTGLTDSWTISGIFSGSSFLYAITCVICGKIADSFPRRVYLIMLSGAILAIFSYLLMGPVVLIEAFLPEDNPQPKWILMTVGYFLLSLSISLIFVPIPRALQTIFKANGCDDGLLTSGMIASLYNALWYLGTFIGPLMGGHVTEEIGFGPACNVMAAIGVAAVITMLVGMLLQSLRERGKFQHLPVNWLPSFLTGKKKQSVDGSQSDPDNDSSERNIVNGNLIHLVAAEPPSSASTSTTNAAHTSSEQSVASNDVADGIQKHADSIV